MKTITIPLSTALNARKVEKQVKYRPNKYETIYRFEQTIKLDIRLIRKREVCYVHSDDEKRELLKWNEQVKFKEVIIDGEKYPDVWEAYI